MSQPQTYNSHAERQAAYRKRRSDKLGHQPERKGLPPLPCAKTNVAGHGRWREIMEMVESYMIRGETEMETYHDDRTERRQRSERAEAFQQKLDDLRAGRELVSEWIA